MHVEKLAVPSHKSLDKMGGESTQKVHIRVLGEELGSTCAETDDGKTAVVLGDVS